MHRALHGASRQICTVRGLATKNEVRSETRDRISLFKYGRPRITFRENDESLIKADQFQACLPGKLEGVVIKSSPRNSVKNKLPFNAFRLESVQECFCLRPAKFAPRPDTRFRDLQSLLIGFMRKMCDIKSENPSRCNLSRSATSYEVGGCNKISRQP